MWQPLNMLGALAGFQQNPGTQGQPVTPTTPGGGGPQNPNNPVSRRLNGGNRGMPWAGLDNNFDPSLIAPGQMGDFRQGMRAYGQQLAPWLQQMPGGQDMRMHGRGMGGGMGSLAMGMAGNPSGVLSAFGNGSAPSPQMQSWWDTRPVYGGSMAPFGG